MKMLAHDMSGAYIWSLGLDIGTLCLFSCGSFAYVAMQW
jgi:hypothetical protein